MPSNVKFRIRDYDGEKTIAEIPGVAVDETNFAAAVADLITMQTAIQGVTIGVIEHVQMLAVDDNVSAAAVTNPFAQRETKWLVTMRGNSSQKLYHREIGAANLALLQAGSDDMAAGAARTALVSALEDQFRGDADETVTVQSIKHVGRNS